MSRFTRLARRAVKVSAAGADLVARPPAGIVILAYHQVGAPHAGPVNLPVSLFDAQMAHLASGASGPVVSLDTAVGQLTGDEGSARRPGNRVVITFDDGTADFVRHAVPILVRHGLPATLYLATDFVEAGRSFWDDGTVLTWPALRDAVATGLITIGSHTHTHALLDRASAATVDVELDRSVELIGERLGVDARHFAYPKALAPSPAADRAVRARFDSAAVAGGRPNPMAGTDLGRLARTPIQVGDGLGWFRRKAAGGLRFEGELRERIDRRRHGQATR